MFYFLIILGLASIIIGVLLDNSRIKYKDENKNPSYKEVEELYLLNERVKQLEQLLTEIPSNLEEIEDIEEKNSLIENTKNRNIEVENVEIDNSLIEDLNIEDMENNNYGLDKYKLLLEYKAKNYSLEEICTKLNMNKGEVLLLKNLYKDYQD